MTKWIMLLLIFLMAPAYAAKPIPVSVAATPTKDNVVYKDAFSKQLVDSIYFDCFQISPSFTDQYVTLTDIIDLTLNSIAILNPSLVFQERLDGRVYGVLAMGGGYEGGTREIAFIIGASGRIHKKPYKSHVIHDICASGTGNKERQWKTAKELGLLQ